jgi:phosphoglycolate phosphatase-like HAD superfamily hydrolase
VGTIKVIGFDFDGTLVQSNAIKRHMFFRVARQYGGETEVVDEIVTRALSAPKADRHTAFQSVVDELTRLGKLPDHPAGKPWAPELVKEYTTLTEEAIVACPEVPGALEALTAFRAQGYALFLNSATPVEPFRRIIDLRNMSGFFHGVYGNEGGKVGNILHALNELGCEPDEMVFIGDGEADRAASEEVGCPFVGLESEFSKYRKRPERLISDMREAVEAVTTIAQNQNNTIGQL